MTRNEHHNKFLNIVNLLNKENIFVNDYNGNTFLVEDLSCNFKLWHNLMSWFEIFRIVDVVDMIVSARDDFKKQNNLLI